MIKDEEGVGNYKLEHFYYIVMSKIVMRLAKLICTMYLQGQDMERSTSLDSSTVFSLGWGNTWTGGRNRSSL